MTTMSNDMNSRIDLLCLGAINVDYVARQADLQATSEESEEILSPAVAERMLEKLSKNDYRLEPGGSAFNTARSISAMKTDLNLSFIGVLGTREDSTQLEGILNRDDFAKSYIRKDHKNRPGTCIALKSEQGRRVLRTYPFANRGIAGWLDEIWELHADEISSARMLHVTSLFGGGDDDDNHIAERVRDFVYQLKSRNPGLLVSFDPGVAWIIGQLDIVRDILKICDFVFINSDELADLAFMTHNTGANTLDKMAEKVFSELPSTPLMLVLKMPDEVIAYKKLYDGILPLSFKADALGKADLKNPVGTGDALAAGFLTGKLLGFDTRESIWLGQDLAREKLRHESAEEAELIYRTCLEKTVDSLCTPVSRRWDVKLQDIVKNFHRYATAFPRFPGAYETSEDSEIKPKILEFHIGEIFEALLKKEFKDVGQEIGVSGGADRIGRCDFGLPDQKILVEIKFLRENQGAQAIYSALEKQIFKYSAAKEYRYLFIFIYDPFNRIGNETDFSKLERLAAEIDFDEIRLVISRP